MAKRYERVEGGGTRPTDAWASSSVVYNLSLHEVQSMKGAVFDTEW